VLGSRRRGTHNMLLCHPSGVSSADRSSSSGARRRGPLGREPKYDIIHVIRTAKRPTHPTAPCLCRSTPPSLVARKDGRIDAGTIKCYAPSTDGQTPTSRTASPAVRGAQAALKEAVRAVGALTCSRLSIAAGVPRVLLADFPWSLRSLVRTSVALRLSLAASLSICLQSLRLLLVRLIQRSSCLVSAWLVAPCYVEQLFDTSKRAGSISISRMLVRPLGGAAN